MISHVISWYAHIWYHSMISHCDVICDVTSLALAQAPGPPSLVAEGATSSLSAEAWSTNPKSTPAPSPRQPAWNTSASGPEKSDHAQKRFCPLADRPNQRHPKNRISFQWNCPMKNFNWFQVFNLGRTWRWLCRLWCDEVPRKLDRQRHPKNRISVQKVNNNEAFIISIARIKIGGRIQCLVKKSKWPILRKNQNGLASS